MTFGVYYYNEPVESEMPSEMTTEAMRNAKKDTGTSQ
jgi:hypothetical protein